MLVEGRAGIGKSLLLTETLTCGGLISGVPSGLPGLLSWRGTAFIGAARSFLPARPWPSVVIGRAVSEHTSFGCARSWAARSSTPPGAGCCTAS
ncbi:hypothetical protein [Deinococcus sp.]|uniref:hypothetical protein n=1 Tax=Deinococcus sp. TaxID=47478 RepID=UPI003C7E2DA9